MGKLDAAQRKWLVDLGALVGSDAPALKAQAEAPEVDTEHRPEGDADAAMPAASPPVEVLEDRRREFKRARAQWVAVKQRAEEDLELVKAGARKVYRADAVQFPKVVAGCKAIDTILDNLDDELRDTLDRYASTPVRAQAKLSTLAATAIEVLDRYQRYVGNNEVMRAIDEKEFADVTVHAPVVKALRDLRKALA